MSTATATPRATFSAESGNSQLRLAIIAGVVLLLVGLGYWWYRSAQKTYLPKTYGRRRGPDAGDSVSGTSVLAELFQKAGHKVRSIHRLSPKLENFEVVVWAPDDFAPPTIEQQQRLEDWLAAGQGRTLVYIGRDYDASSQYWKDVQIDAPPSQLEELQRRYANATSSYETERSAMPEDEFVSWFTVKRDAPRREVTKLDGPWADGVDSSKTSIIVQGLLEPPDEDDPPQGSKYDKPEQVEVLLSSEGKALVTRATDSRIGDGQIIVLTNGSFVLNYPLVNHENRKLAAKLVNECATTGDVAFLESGAGGPEVLDEEPDEGIPTGLGLIRVWPLNVIILHLTMLGIVYCFARWPIFGRAKNLPPPRSSDFGKHVTALGQLMQRSHDTGYANARLQQYRDHGKRESGRSHAR